MTELPPEPEVRSGPLRLALQAAGLPGDAPWSQAVAALRSAGYEDVLYPDPTSTPAPTPPTPPTPADPADAGASGDATAIVTGATDSATTIGWPVSTPAPTDAAAASPTPTTTPTPTPDADANAGANANAADLPSRSEAPPFLPCPACGAHLRIEEAP
jgi:hypothetical protein